jgi:hypothetical protein
MTKQIFIGLSEFSQFFISPHNLLALSDLTGFTVFQRLLAGDFTYSSILICDISRRNQLFGTFQIFVLLRRESEMAIETRGMM